MSADEAQADPPGELLQIQVAEGIVVGRVRSNVAQPGYDTVEADIYDAVADRIGRCRYKDGILSDYTPPAPAPSPPDNPTLSDWRVALTLWKQSDGTLRLDEVTAKVAELVADGNPVGRIARERLEYANNVLRAQLLQLRADLGFSEAEIDESLWRAEQVRLGDLSGRWPVASAEDARA